MKIPITQAKTRLYALVRHAQRAREDVTLTRNGHDIAVIHGIPEPEGAWLDRLMREAAREKPRRKSNGTTRS
jgi:antitoxin (DNA-binding transcriptional repressor) of toxin-antitoxin stability system